MRRNNNSPKCTRNLIKTLVRLSDGNSVLSTNRHDITDFHSKSSLYSYALLRQCCFGTDCCFLLCRGLKEKVIQNRRKYLGIVWE